MSVAGSARLWSISMPLPSFCKAHSTDWRGCRRFAQRLPHRRSGRAEQQLANEGDDCIAAKKEAAPKSGFLHDVLFNLSLRVNREVVGAVLTRPIIAVVPVAV